MRSGWVRFGLAVSMFVRSILKILAADSERNQFVASKRFLSKRFPCSIIHTSTMHIYTMSTSLVLTVYGVHKKNLKAATIAGSPEQKAICVMQFVQGCGCCRAGHGFVAQ